MLVHDSMELDGGECAVFQVLRSRWQRTAKLFITEKLPQYILFLGDRLRL